MSDEAYDTKLEDAYKHVFERLLRRKNAKDRLSKVRRRVTGEYAVLPRDENGKLLACKRGHALSEDNIIRGVINDKRTGRTYEKRTCKQCHRDGERRRRAARRAAAKADSGN